MVKQKHKFKIDLVSANPDNNISILISGNNKKAVYSMAKTIRTFGGCINRATNRNNLIQLLTIGKGNKCHGKK